MSTTLVLGTAGAVIGGMIGGPVGAQIGWLAGSMLGSLIDPPKVQGPRLNDLKLQRSSYGSMIPIVFGTVRIAGNVIDQTDLEEHSESTGGKGGPEVENFTYSASFAIALCEGPILGVRRIWADGRVIWSDTIGTAMPCTLYLGTETQTADPTLEAINGAGEVPGYRGIAYAVFTDYMLTDFGNRIPLLEFEVYTAEGVFPWRVSAFDPTPDGDTLDCVTYESGAVTVGSYAPGSIYYERVFDLNGVEDAGLAYSGTLSLPSVFIYPVQNLLAASSEAGWYVRDTFTTSYTINPGGGPISGSASGDSSIYKDGNIYALGGNALNGHVFVARWPATDGVISAETGTSDAIYDFGNCANQYSYFDIGTSNNSFVYVFDTYHSPITLIELDLDLALVRSWDLDAEYATLGIVNGYPFTVYENASGDLVFAVDRGLTGSKQLFAYYLNDDLTVTQIAGLDSDPSGSAQMGPVIELGTSGYVLTNDGICSLIPPPGSAILGDIVAALSARTPLTTYDTSELTDTVRGFAVASQMTVRNAIYTLRQGFGFDAVESDDQVVFHKRDGTSIATIPDEDLCAHEYGSDEPEPLKTTRKQEAELPRTVTVTYIDKDLDYQIGAQHSPRQVTSSESDVTLELPIVFTAGEAQQRAWTVQMGEWIERETFEWSLSRKWARLEPCDIVNVRGRVIRITNRIEMPSGVIQFRGVLSAPSIYTQNATGAPAGEGEPEQPPAPGPSVATELTLLDLPLIEDGDYPYGPYAAVAPAALGSWPGATVYKSSDGGTSYVAVGSSATSDIVGEVATALANFAGGNVFDEGNSITVVLGYGGGTLSSASEEAVQNGANACALGDPATGWEVLQYRTATLTAPGTYKLTGLLRGRRGTEWMMSEHAANETFVSLPTTININGSFAELGALRHYKGVSFAATLASATAQTFTNEGVAITPYAPVLLGGGRNASGDLTLNWTPRRRSVGGWPNGVDLPATDPENWQVEIATSGAYTTIVRATGVTVTTLDYTAAQQTSDFGSPQSTVYWRVAQLGSAGLGYYAEATS